MYVSEHSPEGKSQARRGVCFGSIGYRAGLRIYSLMYVIVQNELEQDGRMHAGVNPPLINT
jgi:hypothetical protein